MKRKLKFKMKSKNRMKLFVVVALLVACAGMVLLGNVSQGFQNWDTEAWTLVQTNPDNLYHDLVFADVDGKLENGADGITVTVNDNNVLKLNGHAEEDKVVVVGTTTLKAATDYVFGSNLKNGSNKTVYLRLVNNTSGATIASCYNGSTLITGDKITTDTVVRLEIVVAEEASFNSLLLRPVICEASSTDDIVSFYK